MIHPATFPIMGCARRVGCGCEYQTFRIPWTAIAPHEQQAQKNHGQSLARLAERGGLSWNEALAVLEDRAYSPVGDQCVRSEVERIVGP